MLLNSSKTLLSAENLALEDLHPILQKIYAARHIFSVEELNYDIKYLLHFKNLKDIQKATDLLVDALICQKHILVVGDFDTDGATSTALAVQVLKTFGARHVNYIVPNRFKYGYGLTPEIVVLAEKQDLIITVDNGISSNLGVKAAQEKGIKVLVTDHHIPPTILPSADAIVNPQQESDAFESKNLAGVGVIFYVMLALRERLKQMHWFKNQQIPYPKMDAWLDLVALGTIADMVPLDKNNRILVYHGLKKLQANKVRTGIRALASIANCSLEECTASDLSFKIAPRLNSAGRLKDMSIGIECLLTDDLQKALSLAQQLDELNKTRRSIENKMRIEAFHILEKMDVSSKKTSICLFHPSWHQGITGLVAGRIKEKFKIPSIVFAPTNQPGELKGSARSIPGIHIRDILSTIASQYPEVLTRFGGHAAAAGLSLKLDQYEQFEHIFEKSVETAMTSMSSQSLVQLDGELTAQELNVQFAILLRDAGPWGQAFPEPVFNGCFQLLNQRIVGHSHLQLTLKLENSDKIFKGILFYADLNQWPNALIRTVQVHYRLAIDTWEGRKNIQLQIQKLLPQNHESVEHS